MNTDKWRFGPLVTIGLCFVLWALIFWALR